MKRWLLFLLLLPFFSASSLADMRLNNVQITAPSATISVGSSDESGGTIYTNVSNVSQLFFDQDSGLYVELLSNGTVRVYSGSHWYGIGAGGETNSPTGAQDIQFAVSTNITEITWNTNTTPWTLTWPSVPGPRGYPGYEFPYAGPWAADTDFPTNSGATYGGGYYGCIPGGTYEYPPTNYLSSGEWITLAQPGRAGTDGVDGSEFLWYGTWSQTRAYVTPGLVYRAGYGSYALVSASSNKPPESNADYWELLVKDGADGASGTVVSNAFLAGTFLTAYSYASNALVSYDFGTSYRIYRCIQDRSPVDNPGTGGTPLLDSSFWHLELSASDGAPGSPGTDGTDGAGNMQFEDLYQWDKAYTNYGTVVVRGDITYISITNSKGKIPGTTVGWTNYWRKASGAGRDGGTWDFQIGFNQSTPYSNDAVVIVSNIFWKAIQNVPAGLGGPWDEPDYWESAIDPEFREYALLDSVAWESGNTYTNKQVIRHDNSTWVVIADSTSSTPSTNNAAYAVLAYRGADGEAGPAGVNTIAYTNLTSNVWTTVYMPTNTIGTNTIMITNVEATAFTEGTSNWFGFVGSTLTMRSRTNYSSGSTFTNIGFGLTRTGDDTALAVDTSLIATGTPLYAYTETDPELASWLGNNFTGAVEALVESIAVTGAVTSINGEDGAVTLTLSGAGVTTNGPTSWTIESAGTTNILEMYSEETNTTKVLQPDGTNGVQWGTPDPGTTVNGEDGALTLSSGAGITLTKVGSDFSYSWDGTTNVFQYWMKENGTNVLVTSDGEVTNKVYYGTNAIPTEGTPIAVEAGLVNIGSGPGQYALTRTVDSNGTINTEWSIIRGQVTDYINASYTWTPWGVTNKFYVNGTNDQTYTIPAGVTQVVIKCWGAGGGGGSGGRGGYTRMPISSTAGDIITIRVGNPGAAAIGAGVTNIGGWPGGGTGRSGPPYNGGGGGGYTACFLGTNIVCIAGAGGGAAAYSGSGAGGGSVGGNNAQDSATGGTQSSGGISNGAYLSGGDGVYNKDLGCAGGGGGFYGGGGSSSDGRGGAGGSGYISNNEGYTVQGNQTTDPDYEAGIGVANGNGMVVILHAAPEGE